MIFIRDRLTFKEVESRFDREGYTLLSTEYKNAKSNLKILCPHGHEWTTNISNFDFGRRCSICSRRKKYALEEVKIIFANEGYQVLDSNYINGKTAIKVICPCRHEIEFNLNNFMNGRRCNLCRRVKVIEDRMKKLELMLKSKVPRHEVEALSAINKRTINDSSRQVKSEWLDKLDDMRKNLKSGKST
jgi:hypothetical protein